MRPRRSSAKIVIFSDWQRSQRGKSIYYNVPLAPLTIRRFTSSVAFLFYIVSDNNPLPYIPLHLSFALPILDSL